MRGAVMKRAAITLLLASCGPVVGDAGDVGGATTTTDATTSPPMGTSVSSASGNDPTSPPAETTAPPNDDTSTTDDVTSADEGVGFIIDPDGGGPSLACNQWTQDCPRGEKCMPWANDGSSSWNAAKCTPIDADPKDVGEPCTAVESGVSGIDDCVLGAMCWDVDPETLMGVCVGFCQGGEANPTCADECSSCYISSGGAPIVCLFTCHPIAQDCAEGDGCYPVNDAFDCEPDASDEAGAIGDACEFINVCDPGNFCANPESVPGCEGSSGCCAPFCNVDTEDVCDALLPGTWCVPWYEKGQKPQWPCGSPGVIGACVLPP